MSSKSCRLDSEIRHRVKKKVQEFRPRSILDDYDETGLDFRLFFSLVRSRRAWPSEFFSRTPDRKISLAIFRARPRGRWKKMICILRREVPVSDLDSRICRGSLVHWHSPSYICTNHRGHGCRTRTFSQSFTTGTSRFSLDSALSSSKRSLLYLFLFFSKLRQLVIFKYFLH